MEEQTTWKGHTFTLLVFTGIVVLCSIFFILGMLVGHAEGQKVAGPAPAATAAKNEAKPKEDKQDLSFYDSLKKEEPLALQPAPAKSEPAPVLERPKKSNPEPEPAATSSLPQSSANVVYYQIGVFSKSAGAEKLLTEVKKKGFARAFILQPSEGAAAPLFKVQVGPFADSLEAEDVKKKLERAEYKPILKK